jgi:hypothetical protein
MKSNEKPSNERILVITYDFFLAPFFLKFLGFFPQVIVSQLISSRRGIFFLNNNNNMYSITP